MKLSRFLTGIPSAIVAVLAIPLLCGAKGPGCGGNDPISIGSDGTGGGTTSGTGGGSVQCDKTSCGPALGLPNYTCPDGTTVAGPTGNCIPTADGKCGWEVVSCPPSTTCDKAQCGPEPGIASYLCPDGSIGGFTGQCVKASDGTCGWEIRQCPSPTATCDATQCGPQPGVPTIKCSDGSIGGFTGQCLKQPDGTCGWEIRQCPTSGLTWYQGCGAPVCKIGYDDPNIPNCTSTEMLGDACTTSGQTCEIPSANGCSTILVCASTPPDTSMCPISRAKYKNGIEYVDNAELTRVHDELVRMKLARWHYNGEPATQREHFGFIIDDDPSSPAVAASGEQVDLYGYASMATAAIQVQAKQIEALQHEVDALRKQVARAKW